MKRKSLFKRWWFWGIVVVVIIIAAASNGGNKGNNTTQSNANAKTNNTQPAKAADTKITYDNFMKIKMGEKLADVESLLGKGTEQSSTDVGGVKSAMYSWDGDGLSNMNVTIENNVVTAKAQMGLEEMDAKVTMDKYNQIKTGMSYAQVKQILGEGQVTSDAKVMGTETIMYSWINADGTNMECTFTGGKMDTKAQMSLK